jgi:hypothetical protein
MVPKQPFRGRRRSHPKIENSVRKEDAVFSCDYNGWADVPEEEREGLDVFEFGEQVSDGLFCPMLMFVAAMPDRVLRPERLAA